jgi:hypothetical protein
MSPAADGTWECLLSFVAESFAVQKYVDSDT